MRMSKVKINYPIIIFFSVFVFAYTLRTSILRSQLLQINIIYLFVSIIFIIRSVLKKKFNPIILYLSIFLSLIVLTNTVFINRSPLFIILTISCFLIPIFIIGIKLDKESTIKSLKTMLKIMNILCIILIILGIIDYLTKGSIQVMLSNTIFYGTEISYLIREELDWGIYRYYSIIGHPLVTAQYFIVFYILNSLYNRYSKDMIIKNIPLMFITLLGLILSGSKTALIIGILLIITNNGVSRRGIIYISIFIGILVILLNTPLFKENLLERYLEGIKYGDITSGRNTLLEKLYNSDLDRPGILLGGGSGYSRNIAKQLNGNIYNFEYPIIMLAYDYGIVVTLITYILILFYPLLFLRKDKIIMFNFLLYSILVNTNNGIASLGDSMAQLTLLILFMKSLTSGGCRSLYEENINY